MAHPDDIEILCAGTLLLLRKRGWQIHLATMTAGDLGSATLSPKRISAVRRKEAANSAKLLGAGYTCLGFKDLSIVYDVPGKRRVSALLRKIRPDLLITHNPTDYMADHEETSRLAREGAFAAAVPNWRCGTSAKALDHLPTILYADPIDLSDIMGRRQDSALVVDITHVIEKKTELLACHASQREWLRSVHGVDEYLLWMRRMGSARAADAGNNLVKFAEGFNLHKGHGFPAENILQKALGDLCTSPKISKQSQGNLQEAHDAVHILAK
jgi:LmbE family N-acetylglucosaminyl deacetylase